MTPQSPATSKARPFSLAGRRLSAEAPQSPAAAKAQSLGGSTLRTKRKQERPASGPPSHITPTRRDAERDMTGPPRRRHCRYSTASQRRCVVEEPGGPHETLDPAEVFLTSDGLRPNCSRKRLAKWEELLNPIE